jgi:anthranilate phosphoribosyltransferase
MSAETVVSALDNFGGWPAILGTLTRGEDLELDAAEALMTDILSGTATPAQISAAIVALRMKGESVDEMTGLVRGMYAHSVPLEVPDGAIDIVGAGGAPSRQVAALNVSTMAAFVAAAAGARVCKHGNRKASSTSGAFDFLEAIGVNIDLEPAKVAACVEEIGIGFAFARTFHPGMRFAGPVRAEIGVKTVFNILGPLANPARVKRQLIGVADPAAARRMIEVLRANGSVRSLLVTGDGELDELSTTGPSQLLELRDGGINAVEIDAQTVGIDRPVAGALDGGDAEANAAIAQQVFAGEKGAPRDIVVLNAGAALMVAGVAETIGDGVELARIAIDDGSVTAKVTELAAFTNQ